MTTATAKKPKGKISAKWQKLLRLIPGYDPFRDSAGCWFDESEASRAVDFFPELLRHVEGAMSGKPFHLEDWQKSIIGNIFGWKTTDELGREVRRFREVFLYVARKNGKTPLVAGIAAFVFFCDDEAGQQNYVAAGEREQAGMLFRQIRGMVDQEPLLSERCQVYGGNASAGQSKSLVREADGSFLRVISADASGKHGGNTHLAIIDELHVQPNRELVDVLQTSMASANRRQPLMISITTADYARPSICNQKYDHACKVRDGIFKDPAFLPVVYECLPQDDWTDEKVWWKANPNLGTSVSLKYLKRECERARQQPEYENTFKRLHLNIRTEQANRIISMEAWNACEAKFEIATFGRRPVFAGLDIGATSDFTAFVLMFPEDDGQMVMVPVRMDEPDGEKQPVLRRSYWMKPYFWLPSIPVRRDQRMQDQIDTWARLGFIRRTFGNVVDYDQVLEDIKEILKPFSLGGIAVDRGFQGSAMCTNLMKIYGDKVKEMPQGILSMNMPFREFRELITTRRLKHDGHPVMKWMASNTAAEERGGLCKPSKEHSTEKIDGITAATMALGIALTTSPPGSVYDRRGIFHL